MPIPLLEEKDFSFDPDEVLSLVTPRTRLAIINSPANPTGGAIPREALDRLVAGLVEHPHVAILSDEIYARMTYDGREHVEPCWATPRLPTGSSCSTAGARPTR